MNKVAVVIVVACWGVLAAAQVSDAEYQRKLDEFQKKASTRPAATTAPAAGGGGGGAGAKLDIVKAAGWTLKADAPDDIKAWFRNFAKLKPKAIASLANEVNAGPAAAASGGGVHVSFKDKQQALAAARMDPHFIPWPDSGNLTPGTLTTTGETVLSQVMGDGEAIVVWGTQAWWISKFPTAGQTDGLPEPSMVVRVIGTKRYQTADGASRTVLHMEAIQLEDYLAEWPKGYQGPKANTFVWPGYVPVKAKFDAANKGG